MDVVFEGALSSSWGMKDVLQAVVGVPNVPNGLIRVSCPARNIQGKILVSEAKHIVGASCTGLSSFDAYDALRTLLDLTEGSFAFLDLACHTQTEFDPSLFICINRLLALLPKLPSSSSELFDEQSLLDKIFGDESALEPNIKPSTATEALAKKYSFAVPTLPRTRAGRHTSQTPSSQTPTSQNTIKTSAASGAAPITQWNILEPLFNNPQATHTDHIDCGASKAAAGSMADYIQAENEQRSSMIRLRALPDTSKEFSWQRFIKNPQPLKWFLAALGFSLMFCLIAPKTGVAGGVSQKAPITQTVL